jgi:hypothetical protein
MLTSIPVISPIDIRIGETGVRLLPSPPDYEVDALPAPAAYALDRTADPAANALDEIERAAQVSEYHDFSWWDERIRIIRTALAPGGDGDNS